MTYAEKLKDPRWQKLRLQVMERDRCKCLCCDGSKSQLQIHHLIYIKGNPWDSLPEHLETLCRDCHQWREQFNEHAGRSLLSTRFCQDFETFYELILNGEKVVRKPTGMLHFYALAFHAKTNAWPWFCDFIEANKIRAARQQFPPDFEI